MSVTPAAAANAAAVAGVHGILLSVDVTSDATPKAWQACSGLRSTCFTATVKGRWGSPAAEHTILEYCSTARRSQPFAAATIRTCWRLKGRSAAAGSAGTSQPARLDWTSGTNSFPLAALPSSVDGPLQVRHLQTLLLPGAFYGPPE